MPTGVARVEALLLSLTVTGPIGVEDLAERFPIGPEISIHYRRYIFWATPRATALVAQGPYPPLVGGRAIKAVVARGILRV